MTVTETFHDLLSEVAPALEAARTRGAEWIVSRLGPDGEPPAAEQENAYYRVPWALAQAGYAKEAASVLSWMEREALETGDLRAGAPQTPWTSENASYPLAVMATGAWHLERYDTANSIMETLRAYQHPVTGGSFVERPEHRTTGRQEVLCTAQLGMAALLTGRIDVADGAFHWFRSLWDAQPDLPRKLYLAWDDKGLVTEFADDVAFGRVIDFQAPRQAFFNPGIAAAFLGRYAMATGTAQASEIAREMIRLSEGGTELQYDWADTVHVGKIAWGASIVFEVAPDLALANQIVRMAQWLRDCQPDDGGWAPSHFLFPNPNDADVLWKTAEHIMIINFMLAAIGGHHRAR
jgi:hypothetical protein